MRIAVDIEPFFRNRAGVGRYIGELIPAMMRLENDDRFTLFRTKTHAGDGQIPGIDPAVTEEKVLPGSHRALSLKWLLLDAPAVERMIGEHDVYFAPQLPAFATRGCFVATILDLVWRRMPEVYPRYSIWTRRLGYRRALKRTRGIVTISEASRRDILETYDVDERHLRAIHLGVGESFRTPATEDRIAATLDELDLRRPYVLSVAGDNNPKKNLVRLVRAFARLSEEFKELTLACVGRPRYRIRALKRGIAELAIPGRVRLLGRVSDEALKSLYAGAVMTAYPSLYEGFGFPLVESMSQGTPVVTSNVSSMPEVAGEAALLVDPQDVDDLTAAMRRLLADEALHAELSRKGLDRAKGFTWEKTARRTRDFLAESCSG